MSRSFVGHYFSMREWDVLLQSDNFLLLTNLAKYEKPHDIHIVSIVLGGVRYM